MIGETSTNRTELEENKMKTVKKQEKSKPSRKSLKIDLPPLMEDETQIVDLMNLVEGVIDTNDNEQISFTLGDQQDRVVTATQDEVSITSKSDPRKTMTFNANRWAHFRAILSHVDGEARELNRKARPVAYCQHIGDGYYVSVTSGIMCVDIRKFYLPYGLSNDQVRPSKSGIALRLDEWAEMLLSAPVIDAKFPSLAHAKPCADDESHMNQLGWLECRSCFPFQL